VKNKEEAENFDEFIETSSFCKGIPNS